MVSLLNRHLTALGSVPLFTLALTSLAAVAHAVDVSCDAPGGDASGWTVAANGDFDGDGIDDVAMGAPCSVLKKSRRVGRVIVYSGADWRRIRTLKGTKALQRMGSSLSFIDDLTGDGRDELLVGSLGWDVVTANGTTLTSAGKVEVYSYTGGLVATVEGVDQLGNFGESVLGLSDLTGDGIPDWIAGAGDARVGPDRVGRASLVSGADGSIVDISEGVLRFDSWGSVLGTAGDIDGDGIEDPIIASHLADTLVEGLPPEEGGPPPLILQENNGIARVVSGLDFTQVLAECVGAEEEKLARAVGAAGDTGILVGVAGTKVAGLNRAGSVRLYSWAGEFVREYIEPEPEIAAAFGTSLTVIGDVDGGGIVDFAAGSPNGKGVDNRGGAGRVHAISTETGEILWTLLGERKNQAMGNALASTGDVDGDAIGDLAIGVPHDTAAGRRGAGSVLIVSGATGEVIKKLNGRRGLETRLYVAGYDLFGNPRVRSFDHRGRGSEVNIQPFRGGTAGALSISLLDEGSDPVTGRAKLVVGTGRGALDDWIRAYYVGRRLRAPIPISNGSGEAEFRGIGGSYAGGVNVAVGDVLDDDLEEIIAAQADTPDHRVELKIWRQLDTDPILGTINWFERGRITAFSPADKISFVSVDADGVNVAVGNLVQDSEGKEEIVVAPIVGAPVVRVFSANGTKLAEWLAYLPDQNLGTQIAVGDLDGDGVKEVVTAPEVGQPWIKAFNADGTPFKPNGSGSAVSFFAFPATMTTGLRVAVADVDLDGVGEILVGTGDGVEGIVQAFESDGTLVGGNWKGFLPFGPVAGRGLVLEATDRYLRY